MRKALSAAVASAIALVSISVAYSRATPFRISVINTRAM